MPIAQAALELPPRGSRSLDELELPLRVERSRGREGLVARAVI
jgi:hypothetical protein